MKNAKLFRGRSGETNRGIRAFAKISSSTSFFYAVSALQEASGGLETRQ